MNIIILGSQGSGKGTQAEMLAKKYDLEHIDMGKTLRSVAKQDTPLGREIYSIQNVTKTLVPSRILREVMHLEIGSLERERGIVFDGVPRTMDQAEYLEGALQEFGRKLDKVFFINISKEESSKRISARWSCSACNKSLIMGRDIQNAYDVCPMCKGKIAQRIDDNQEGIEKRLKVFQAETLPVIEYFKTKGVLVEIDGAQPAEKVFAEIIENLRDIV